MVCQVYIYIYQSLDMQEKAILSVRQKVGLSDDFFYINDVESSHNVLKQSCNRNMSDCQLLLDNYENW